MAKSAQAFRTIGELSEELGVKPHILRYWEEQFPMLSPLKRAGNRRHYRPEDVALVKTIDRLLNEDGYTIRGARNHLRKKAQDGDAAAGASAGPVEPPASSQPADAALPVAAGSGADRLVELRGLRDRLARALEAS